jgi:exodeoxyribonuclease V alpha subunit
MNKTAVVGLERVALSGQVHHLFFSSPDFSAGVISLDSQEEVRFAGKIMVQVGEQVILHGHWESTKYGDQIKVEAFEYQLPVDQVGMANYIANNPRVKGLGPVRARIIAERFGNNLDHALAEQSEEVARAAKVPVQVIHNLRSEWASSRLFNVANSWLASFELTHNQVTTLVKKFGNSVVAIFKQDPYLLIREIDGYGFKKVDIIARKMGTRKDHPSRIRGGILHCMTEALDQGHCWTEYEDLVDQANKLLVMDSLDSRDIIRDHLDYLVEEKLLVCEALDSRLLVAKPELRQMEEDLARVFSCGAAPSPHAVALENIGPAFIKAEEGLTEGQCLAVKSVLGHSISVIAGGAGTGKTFTVSTICELFEQAGLCVLLCAPTGKAAKRLEESTGREASTIHRLLEYNGREFQFDGKLQVDLLLVDEVSMVDVPLFWHLLSAVDLERTCIALVGDHNQLPPVGPGNVLRDLIQTKLVPVIVLDQVVRQAGILKENCSATLKGRVGPSSPVEHDGLRAWYRMGEFSDEEDLMEFVLALYKTKLQDDLGLDLIRDIQLLTPTRKGDLGVNSFNIRLQRLLQRKLHGREVEPVPVNRRPRPLAGDKIIQRRNNYSLGVMNGTVGYVVVADEQSGDLRVLFDGVEVTLLRSEGHLKDIDLAYALTIHQTQGSEFPVVIVILHKSHSFQHHRNLAYTGVTRAKRSAIILGDHWGIRNCVQQVRASRRRTWLGLSR